MICKNCTKEIYLLHQDDTCYTHVSGKYQCELFATPIIAGINRHLDAKRILAEMEARRPVPPPAKHRQPNPDYVEGSFEGEL